MRIFTKTLVLAFLFFVASASAINAQKISPELSSLLQNKQATSDNGKTTEQAQMTSVKITGIVSSELVNFITKSGGKVFSSDVVTNVILAKVPIEAVNKIAANADVKYIDKAKVVVNEKNAENSAPKDLFKAEVKKGSK